jgi:hypothetical protein
MADTFLDAFTKAFQMAHQTQNDMRLQEVARQQALLHQMQMLKMAAEIQGAQQDQFATAAPGSAIYNKRKGDVISTIPDKEKATTLEGLLADKVHKGEMTLQDAYKIKKAQEEKPKEINVSNEIESILAGMPEFKGYYTDSEVRKKALDYYAENSDAVREKAAIYARSKTPPVYTPVLTDKGIVPFGTRGPNAGNFQPTPNAPKKPLSAAEADEMAALDSVLESVNKTKKLYKKEFVGPVAGRKGAVTGAIGKGTTEDEQEFRASNAEIKKTLFDLGGKQLTLNEIRVLTPFLPDVNDPPITYEMKVKNFETKYRDILSKKTKRFTGMGYGVGNAPNSNAPPFDATIEKPNASYDYEYIPGKGLIKAR